MSTEESLQAGNIWQQYYELTKPRVVALITFTAIVGMLMSVPGALPWTIVVFGVLGIFLVAAGAAAINQLVDRRIDGEMKRTQSRPIPQGAISTTHALIFALSISLLGAILLWIFTNPLCTILTMLSLLGYAVIYTMYLKRATPQNIVIGGAAGAAPPLLGWVAVTNSVDIGAVILFMIIFFWTPPHFWALAIHRKDEYAKVNIPMLPVTHGVELTRLHILLYSILLAMITVMPYMIGMSGLLYLVSVVWLNGRYMWMNFTFFKTGDDSKAMPSFVYSIKYLMYLFAALLIDHYLYYHPFEQMFG
jgi:protoheme IX farnesyltransferase